MARCAWSDRTQSSPGYWCRLCRGRYHESDHAVTAGPGVTPDHAGTSRHCDGGRVNRILGAGLLAGALVAGAPAVGCAQQTQQAQAFLPAGTLAPDVSFMGATRYGMLAEPVRLSQFHGQTVVIAFFFRARSPG
jgi:hypothetical protein